MWILGHDMFMNTGKQLYDGYNVFRGDQEFQVEEVEEM